MPTNLKRKIININNPFTLLIIISFESVLFKTIK